MYKGVTLKKFSFTEKSNNAKDAGKMFLINKLRHSAAVGVQVSAASAKERELQ